MRLGTAVVLMIVSWCTAMVALGTAAPGAGADTVSSLQAQAASLSQKMLLEQLQVGADSSQYQAAVAQVAQDNVAITATEAKITANRTQIATVTAQAREEAVWAYVHAGSSGSDPVTGLFTSDAATQARANEYAQVVGGDLETTVADLHTAQVVLAANQTELQHEQAQDQATQTQAATLLSAAQSTESQLSTAQSQVNGELAVAVAQAQATQAQTAAAAVRTADTKSTSSSASTSTSQSSAGSAVPAPASNEPDPPLPPFLQCVVQRESGGNYAAVSPDGLYMGAFQFSQGTWNYAAQLAGRPDLIGVAPSTASKADQDTLAIALYAADGSQPWLDGC
jgi:Transglycosylase-like domain